MKKELVKMAHAHVNQHSKGSEKTDWFIRENATEDLLGELPKKLNEKEVFYILNLVRKYELDALNVGIDYGKKQYKEVFDKETIKLRDNLKAATVENERLAEVLDEVTKRSINSLN